MSEDSGARVRRVVRAAGAFALLLAVAVLAYRRSFTVPFQLDDVPSIVRNPAVHLTGLDWNAVIRAAGWADGRFARWLAYLSFGLNHWAAGLSPFGWHLVNLGIHVACGAAVLLLGRRVLGLATSLPLPSQRRAALWAALLFVAHPVQTQAVTYVVQRMTSLGALFGLLAVEAWLAARARGGLRAGYAALALALTALAVSCKENFLVVPAIAILCDVVLLDGAAVLRRRWRSFAAGCVAFSCIAGLLAWRYAAVIASEHVRFGISVSDRLLTAPRVVWHYLSLLAWPVPERFQSVYDYAPSRGLLEPPATLVALLGLAALVVLAAGLRRRAPIVTLAIAWFLLGLVVETTVLPLDLVFEHRVYFPSFGVFVLAGFAVERASVAAALRVRGLAWAAAAALVAALVVSTDLRHERWNDPLEEAEHVIARSEAGGLPLARTLLTAGAARLARGDLDGAEADFRRSLQLEPGSPTVRSNLGDVAVRRRDWVAAESWYRDALAQDPSFLEAWFGLVAVHGSQGHWVETERALNQILALAPAEPRAIAGLGGLALERGDLAGAQRAFESAVRVAPASPAGYAGLATVLAAVGRMEEAIDAARQAARKDPANPRAKLRLADLLIAGGGRDEARAVLAAVISDQPRTPDVHFRLGNLALDDGDLVRAEREFLLENEVAPHAGALGNLGTLQLERDPARARELYGRALALDPSNAAARAGLELLDR